MKNVFKFLTISVFLFVAGCNSDDDGSGEATGENRFNESTTIQVVLPDGDSGTLTDNIVNTLGEDTKVDGSGNAEIPVFGNDLELAFLFDANSNPVLAGFVSKEKTEISLKTTAEVLAYFSVVGYAEKEDLKKEILEELAQMPSFEEFISSLTDTFKADRLMLQKGGFSSGLLNFIDKILDEKTDVDLSNRVLVDEKDVRSGIRIKEMINNSIEISNEYPRRSHAFIYKMTSTNKSGQETVINSAVNGTDFADFDFPIAAPILDEGQTNRSKAVMASLANCGNPIYEVQKTDAQALPLEESELSVLYEVSVIGPGSSGKDREMTEDEQGMFERLSQETFIVDYLLPVLTEISGRKSDLLSLKGSKDEELYVQVKPYLDANSAVNALIFEGDFETALHNYIDDIYKDNNGSFGDAFDIMLDAYDILSGGGNQPYNYILNNEQKKNVTKIAGVINKIANLLSYQCVNSKIGASKSLESWDVTVEDGAVSLDPETMVTSNTSDGKEIIATVVNGGQANDVYEYEWTTSSVFGGFLSDTKGNSGTNFNSDSERVLFISTASSGQLSDGDNIETVSVKVFRVEGADKIELGTASMEVNVKKDKFRIKPNGVTIQGNTDLTLYLSNADGETIIPNSESDYKVVWTTNGSYGLLAGFGTNWTTYNENTVVYRCTDSETEQGVETIYAAIYAKPKNSNEDYRLLDEVSATINIKNEENVKYLYPKVEYDIWDDSNGDGYGYAVFFQFSPEADALNYSLRVKELKFGNNSTSFVNSGKSWTAGNDSDLTDGKYRYITYTGSGPDSARADALAALGTLEGFAEVRIESEP